MIAAKKRMPFYFTLGIVVITVAYWVGALFQGAHRSAAPSLQSGVLDATQWHPDKDRVLSLGGEWEIHYNQLLEPEDFDADLPSGSVVTIPTDILQHARLQDGEIFQGYATLRAVVRLPEPAPDTLYGIRALYLTSSSKVYVNGKAIASVGAVSTDPASYRAQYAPMEAFFPMETQEAEIVIQVANFHHRRVRLGEIWFGTGQAIRHHTYRGIIIDSLATGCLLAITICYLIFFTLHKRFRASLLLAIIAFFTAMRGSIVSERILIRLFPGFSPEWMMKLGFLPAFVLLPLFILYFRNLFCPDKQRALAKGSAIFIGISVLLVLFTNIKVYDWVFEVVQWILGAVSAYMVYVLATNRCFVKTRGGLSIFIGGCVMLLAAINDTLRELNFIHSPEMLTLATVLFIMAQAVFLGWQLYDSYLETQRLAGENRQMVTEIRSMNQLLENKVQTRTKELELANSKLEMLARIDPLTQLANRRWFDERLEVEWAWSKQEGKALSLLMGDIDFFKFFNDTYGHIAGDECLKAIAAELKRCVRNGIDIVARYGGEEFVALLPNTDLETGVRVAQRMRKAVEELLIPNQASSVAEFVTISIGVCSVEASDRLSINQLIVRADKALYRAKENGRNRVELG